MPRSDAGDHTHRGCSGHSSNPGAFGPLGALASGTEKRTPAAYGAAGHGSADAETEQVDLPSVT
jgi:hypothetical protein